MDKITHAARLAILLSEIDRLCQSQPAAGAPSLVHAKVKSPELRAAWKAARHSLKQIKRAQEELPVFSSHTLKAMQRPFGRLSNALSQDTSLLSLINYRHTYLNGKQTEDCDALNAHLFDCKVFEGVAAGEVEALAEYVADLKARIHGSDLDPRLKLTLLALLTRMAEVFETYALLGEQDLDDTVLRWAGCLVKFREELNASNDTNLKSGLLGLLAKIWQTAKFGGDVIDTAKKYSDLLLPPAA